MKRRPLAVLSLAAAALALAGCYNLPQHAYAPPAGPQLAGAELLPTPQKAIEKLPDSATLDDYLAYAALHNPGLEAAFNKWKASAERIPQVTALPDPHFTYSYYIRSVETRVGPQNQAFAIQQMFPWFGKRELRGRIASADADAAWYAYQGERLKLYYRVKNAYFEYYYLARAIDVVKQTSDLMANLESVARTKYEAASGRYADVIRAQVELGKLDDRLRSLQDLREPIVAQLNAALNRPSDAPLPWPTSLPKERIKPSDAELLSWLQNVNPELQGMASQVSKAEDAIALARKDYYPDVMVGLNYIDTGRALMKTSDSGKDPVIAMVSINIPLWLGKLRAAVREAQDQRQQAVSARSERLNSLMAQAKLVLYKYRDADRKVGLYADTLLPKAQQSLETTETGYQAGTSTFLDLVDTERVLLEFELSEQRALADRAQRLAELESLMGREIPRQQPAERTRPEVAPPQGGQ
jgi:cobalt-zinc-cadmium efflux system outer membrane protein